MNKPKFRAWSEPTKEMKYNIAAIDFKRETIYFDNGVTSINNAQETDFWHKPYILMQSTGLKDKNGVEIFEGDKLHYSNCDGEIDVITKRNGCFWSGDTQLYQCAIEEAEIIGNSYEM